MSNSARKILWIVLGITILVWGGVAVYYFFPPGIQHQPSPLPQVSPLTRLSSKNLETSLELTQITPDGFSVVGKIKKVTLSTITIVDPDGNEGTYLLTKEPVVERRAWNETHTQLELTQIELEDLVKGETVRLNVFREEDKGFRVSGIQAGTLR